MFKVKTNFTFFSCVSIVDFEQVNVTPITEKSQLICNSDHMTCFYMLAVFVVTHFMSRSLSIPPENTRKPDDF